MYFLQDIIIQFIGKSNQKTRKRSLRAAVVRVPERAVTEGDANVRVLHEIHFGQVVHSATNGIDEVLHDAEEAS